MKQPTATVIWTRMIDFDFSADVRPIYRQTSAEVKSYTQHCCRETTKQRIDQKVYMTIYVGHTEVQLQIKKNAIPI